MGLHNVAVLWPRLGQQYQPVPGTEFEEFAALATRLGEQGDQAASDLATQVAAAGRLEVSRYTDVVDLLLGLSGVLRATESTDDEEDPVIDPDGCAWIAGGLERFVEGHLPLGRTVTITSTAPVMRTAIETSRLAQQQLSWLQARVDTVRREADADHWAFGLTEIGILARFYRRCADEGYAVFAVPTGTAAPIQS